MIIKNTDVFGLKRTMIYPYSFPPYLSDDRYISLNEDKNWLYINGQTLDKARVEELIAALNAAHKMMNEEY